jgi:hypothetical protein
VAQVLECWPGMQQALGSASRTEKKKKIKPSPTLNAKLFNFTKL